MSSNPENDVHAIRLNETLEVAFPIEMRIVTTLDHPLPGNKLWLRLDGQSTQGFNLLGYTDADYPGKIVLRFYGSGVLGHADPTRMFTMVVTLYDSTEDSCHKWYPHGQEPPQ